MLLAILFAMLLAILLAILLANADTEGSRAGGGDAKNGNIKKGTAGKKYQEEKEQEVCFGLVGISCSPAGILCSMSLLTCWCQSICNYFEKHFVDLNLEITFPKSILSLLSI